MSARVMDHVVGKECNRQSARSAIGMRAARWAPPGDRWRCVAAAGYCFVRIGADVGAASAADGA